MNLAKDKDGRMTTQPPSPPTPEEEKKPQSPVATNEIAQKEANQFTVDSEESTELHQATVHLEIKLEIVVSGSPLNSLQHDLKATKKGDNVSNRKISVNFFDHKYISS
ncbi:uncharacterized protein ACN2A1_013448 [Glossina fuscipes fuscipes]